MRDYQQEGVDFLMDVLRDENKGVAVLADEMGLGKTSMSTNYLFVHKVLIIQIS